MPLALAAALGAAEDVKQVLFEAHRVVVADKALWDIMLWGESAVRGLLEAQPEAAAAPVPTTVAAQPGAWYSSERPPEVGSLVCLLDLHGQSSARQITSQWLVICLALDCP